MFLKQWNVIAASTLTFWRLRTLRTCSGPGHRSWCPETESGPSGTDACSRNPWRHCRKCRRVGTSPSGTSSSWCRCSCQGQTSWWFSCLARRKCSCNKIAGIEPFAFQSWDTVLTITPPPQQLFLNITANQSYSKPLYLHICEGCFGNLVPKTL